MWKDLGKQYDIVRPDFKVSDKCILAWLIDKPYVDSIDLQDLALLIKCAEDIADTVVDISSKDVLNGNIEALRISLLATAGLCGVDTSYNLEQHVSLIRANKRNNTLSVAFSRGTPPWDIDDFHRAFPDIQYFLEFIESLYEKGV